MQRLTLLCVGRLREPFYVDAAAEYVKRLSRYCKTDIVELPESRLPERPSAGEIRAALEKEALSVRKQLPANAFIVALCIEGALYSSEQFSELLSGLSNRSMSPVFVIGGSHGLHPSVKDAAALRLSMSPMTFPHHLARVMLLEQLYRACQIQAGGRYHK
ncbi:MAG: 23S rRNA (pseudouridine(1915)-N(3))-methyltransferase RlmH [Oscillibacter sp.]|nr:23S rRNA (pseudouridine(1915)-N(3))-methyltransferase RlmH [Oscillibacter sp.]